MASQPRVSFREEIVNSNGQRSVLRSWLPEGEARAAIAIAHGGTSNYADYQGIGAALAARGITAHAFEFRDDIDVLLANIQERRPADPLFMFGQGADAVAACLHVLAKPAPLSGLVCASIALDFPVREFVRKAVRWLPVMAPRLAAMIRASDRLRESASRLSLPLLILHGSADEVTMPSGSEYLHGHAGSSDKTLQIFEGYHHDLANEPGREIVVDKICQWIDARLTGAGHRTRIGIEYINEEP